MQQTWRRTSILLALAAFVLVLILWQMPQLSGLIYPFRLFVTTVHELGHGLSAVITGGTFHQYTVDPNGAGLAYTSEGWRGVIIPAGYLGAALFGGALLWLTNRTPYTRTIAIILGIAFGGLTILFARNATAIIAGLASAAALVALGWKVRVEIATFVLNFLAIITGLNAVMDILGLFDALNSGRIAGGNDAQSMADLTGIPAALWALLWVVAALAIVGFALYHTFWRPWRKGQL